MIRSLMRRTALLAGLVVGFGLVAAPVALAQGGTTITAAAGVQFNGVIDSDPGCGTATTLTITWGDGTATSAGRYTSGGSDVIGTHTYARTGSYTGSIAFTGGGCNVGPDPFTATVGATPAFTQCPQVGDDTGCQFLIVASNSGTTIDNDASQTAYEGSEDSLIGVVNGSSDPISAIPLSAPGSGLFSFDGDGICDAFTEVSATAPLPSGCQQIGSPAGTPCDPTSGGSCAYPPAPGQPGADPDAYAGSTQNGYEGPTTYFTSVSADLSSGVVNFSPALQPGQSTYFTLEEPPVNTLAAGGGPSGATFAAPPTVSATGANFIGTVNPNGSPTTVSFQYGLDGNYGIAKSPFTQSTSAQNIGGDFANHVVSGSASGLVPDAIYAVRLVAINKNGTTVGPTLLFTTKKSAPPGAPTIGKTFNVSTSSGLVLIKLNGKFIPLTELRQIPNNTEIDALGGTLSLVASSGGGTGKASEQRPRRARRAKRPARSPARSAGRSSR